jgi:hypothetical protein
MKKIVLGNDEIVYLTYVENRGGKRSNAGYKGKYTESTVLVSLRVPKSLETEVRQAIKDICEPLVKVKE